MLFLFDFIFTVPYPPNAADQEQDWRQACLPTGLSAAYACCEALRAELQADGNPQHCVEREAFDTTCTYPVSGLVPRVRLKRLLDDSVLPKNLELLF